ncbi:MAG: peptide-methionine (S)-S-oxide reductase MsrA [Bacillota bacterium]
MIPRHAEERSNEELFIARFAMGCFWGPDARFGLIEGVKRTRVGYAGGTTSAPTYRNIGDHMETLEIVYDPDILSFADLLDLFLEGHDPLGHPPKRQYASAIFPVDDSTLQMARDRLEEFQKEVGQKPGTEIIPHSRFHTAEDYHQKFYLQGVSQLYRSLLRRYGGFWELIDSTTAARVNGYLGGYGDHAHLAENVDRLDLDDDEARILERILLSRR